MSAIQDCGFSEAFAHAKANKCRIYRKGWNGKGMFVFSVPEGKYPAARNANNTLKGVFEDDLVPYGAYLAIKTVDNVVNPWTPSQSDLYATDWTVSTEEDEEDCAFCEMAEAFQKMNFFSEADTSIPCVILIKLHEDEDVSEEENDDVTDCCSDDDESSDVEEDTVNGWAVKLPPSFTDQTTVIHAKVNSSFSPQGQPETLPDSVTLDFLDSTIKKTKIKFDKKSSMVECRIFLHNSYVSYGTVVVDARLTDDENKERAYQAAFDKLWELYGYVLSSLTYCSKENLSPFVALFTGEVSDLEAETKFITIIANKLSHCSVTLHSGFVVTGESSCVNPDNFSEGIGRGIAYDNAMERLAMLHDFLQIDLAYHCTDF